LTKRQAQAVTVPRAITARAVAGAGGSRGCDRRRFRLFIILSLIRLYLLVSVKAGI
jgi:hypothetical protein